MKTKMNMKMTTGKSKWFYTQFANETKAVVLLAHGLNLNPSKMDQLAHFFNAKKCDVLRISLGDNPDLWMEKFSDDYDAALEHADILQKPLYFVGFSLGALIAVHYMNFHPHHHFSKLALFAPATHTHKFTLLPALLGRLLPEFKLPSLNLINYRERKYSKLGEYKKMHQLQREMGKSLLKNEFNTPTLLILSPRDELVSSSKLTKFADSNPHWSTLVISNRESQLPKKYHHLMIDLESIGPLEWEKILNNLTAHFAL